MLAAGKGAEHGSAKLSASGPTYRMCRKGLAQVRY